MRKVAVITVNYNTHTDTDNFIHSLEKVHTPNFSLDLIVVDNGSKNAYKLPSSAKHITLIRSEENTGFSGGYNIGIREALKHGDEYIMIVNNDTEAKPDMIVELIAVLDSDSRIGMVVPKIYFAKGHEFHKDRYTKAELGNVLWYAGGHVDWANVNTIHRGVDEVDKGQYDTTESIAFATGCCMMFKRETLEKVGVLDEKYFLYYEDADLNERIKRAGLRIYYAPKAHLIHINASSSGGAGNTLQDYFITRNRMLYGMTYAPLRTKIALFRESIRLLRSGRPMQKLAIKDFYRGNLYKGTFFEHRKT